VFEQQVVQLPELPLVRGRLGRLCRELGARMDVCQRQMAPDVAQVAEVPEQLADDRLGLAAVRALEVAVLDQGDGRLRRAAQVVALGVDRIGEIDDRRRRSEQGPDPQPPREHRGPAENEPGEERGAERGREDAELRLLELLPVERERCDQQRDREADAGDGAAAGHGGPADRRPQPSSAQLRHEPRGTENPGRLPGDVADQDPERDARGERS